QRARARGLEQRGHGVEVFATPISALRQLTVSPPDVVIRDLGLPELDGMEVLKMLRAVHDMPIIVASARDDDVDIVAALNEGADDYVVKPFSSQQLDARIRAVLRRARGEVPDVPITVGGLVIDPKTRRASLDGRP